MNNQDSGKNSITSITGKLTTLYQKVDANIEQWFQNFIEELEDLQEENL